MRKFTSLLVLTVLLTVAYTDIVEDFRFEALQWMQTEPIILDRYNRLAGLSDYYGSAVGNTTCLNQFEYDLLTAFTTAAQSWSYDMSHIGDVVTTLISVVLPPMFIKAKTCMNPDIFRKDEAHFEDLTRAVFANDTFMQKEYNQLDSEISYLTKGQIPSNQTCIEPIANHLEVYRLSTIAQASKETQGFPFTAQLVYAFLPDAVKASQQCLTGSDDKNVFDQAFEYWLTQNPDQKAYFDQKSDVITSLTSVLDHDDDCAERVRNELIEDFQNVAGEFRNGDARIGDLSMKLLHVHVPKAVSEARKCLMPYSPYH